MNLCQTYFFFCWCYLQVEGDPLSRRTGLSSKIVKGSLDSGAGALNNAISPVSWSPWPCSSSSSFTAFFVQLVLEDDKMIMMWRINDYINSYLWGHSHWSVSLAQWVPRGQVLSTAACWMWNSFFSALKSILFARFIHDNYVYLVVTRALKVLPTWGWMWGVPLSGWTPSWYGAVQIKWWS